MNLSLVSANLGDFDDFIKPVDQNISEYNQQYWTDKDFPPITGLTSRFQYRIPKAFAWQMNPGHDHYLWFDGSMTLPRPDSAQFFLDQLEGGYDIAVFKHPWRNTIKEEVEHLEKYLKRQEGTKRGQDYLIKRYANGLHMQQYNDILSFPDYVDDHLYASMAFIYKDSEHVRDALREFFLHQARYFTCDQLAFTFALRNLAVKVMDQNVFKNDYITRGNKHD